MSADRVDKSWKNDGIGTYSTDAIFNTLKHYGVSLDEAAFKEAAKESSPLHVASAWQTSWKGKGQFQGFPYAAAEELMSRYFPERLTPFQLAQTVVAALVKGAALLGKTPDGLGSDPFVEFDEKKGSLPPPGELRNLFNSELVGFLDRFAKPFNDMPRDLAKAGHVEMATKLAQMQEDLFPDRAGTVTALVRALSGDRDGAIKELVAIAGDAKRDVFVRHAGIDGLFQAEAYEALNPVGLQAFDACVEVKEWPVADSIAHLLASALAKLTNKDAVYGEEVLKRFALAHKHVGGHGHGR